MPLLVLLNSMPLWLTALAVTVIAEIYSIGLMLLARFRYGVSRLSQNNEIAGFKFAVVGVFYAVLLAFVVIAVWEEYRNTEAAIRDEAKAAIDLHRASYVLPTEGGEEVRKRLIAYLNDVREDEWRTMGVGRPSAKVGNSLDRLTQAILTVEPQSPKQVELYHHTIDLLAVMTDNRNERLDSADGSVPRILWFVLIVGGAITLGYPAFFGATNLLAQILMTASLAALVALSLLLGLAFDYPFSGTVRLSAFPIDEALKQMPPNWPPP
jgi:hypothetical protein